MTEALQGRRRGWEHWALLGGALLVLAGLWLVRFSTQPDPRGLGTHEQLGMPPCNLLEYTGVPCPGCGVTTSLSLAYHGSIGEAFLTQPFGLFLAFALPLFAVGAIVACLRGYDLRGELGRARTRWSAIGMVILLLSAWIYKIVRVVA